MDNYHAIIIAAPFRQRLKQFSFRGNYSFKYMVALTRLAAAAALEVDSGSDERSRSVQRVRLTQRTTGNS